MKINLITAALLVTLITSSFSQVKYSFEFSGGAVLNLPARISIKQENFEQIRLSPAIFRSEPFVLPPYWDWRFSMQRNNNVFELEAIHHKLYLKNRPIDKIQQFSISHGFNMFFVNYGIVRKGFLYRIGLGAVFTHPETIIRNMKFEDEGQFLSTTYYLSGPALNLSIGKRMYFLKRVFVNAEIKNTTAFVKIPVASGTATVFTSTFHFIAGLGYDFIQK